MKFQFEVPFLFRSSFCNVPSQFAAACIPSILSGANPSAQDKSNFNPDKPLFNVAAIEPTTDFNFNFGNGPRISNLRGFSYHNVDFGLMKDTKITEKLNIQFRFEVFNIFN